MMTMRSPRSRPDSRRVLVLLSGLVLTALSSGCIGIRPLPRPKLGTDFLQRPDFWCAETSREGLRLRMRPLVSAPDNLAIFDADLTTIGILPVFVEISPLSPSPLPINPADFRLHWKGKAIGPVLFKRFEKRLLDKYGIRMYSDAEIEAFRNAFTSLELPVSTAGGGPACGVLYFPAGPPEGWGEEIEISLTIRLGQTSATLSTACRPEAGGRL